MLYTSYKRLKPKRSCLGAPLLNLITASMKLLVALLTLLTLLTLMLTRQRCQTCRSGGGSVKYTV